MYVTKRDGTKQEWNDNKIRNAIYKAARAVGRDDVEAQIVSKGVIISERDGMTVEQIQDDVEQQLLAMGCHDVGTAYIRYRHERAMKRFLPAPIALPEYIDLTKYARWLPNERRRENWDEICDRLQDMYTRRWPELGQKIAGYFQHVRCKRLLGSMRSKQFGGAAIEQHNVRMYNCCFTHIDTFDKFGKIFYVLLAGCGVGYSVQRRHLCKLPVIKRIGKRVVHHAIGDTIEGWGDAVTALMRAYFLTGDWVEFDYSQIRPEGTPLITSGGRAPGHLPLRRMLEQLRKVLDGAAERHLRPIEAYDMLCFIGEAVLAGGIRRSSEICLFDADDEEMMTAKTPEHFRYAYGDDPGLNAQRGMSNNSAVLTRDDHDAFMAIKNKVQHYGEPGFFFTDNPDWGTNPCGEIGLDPVIDGESGFAFCNLTEINMATVTDPEDFYERCHVAAALGTLQAAYMSFPYLGEATERIAARDALLGVGLTGMQDCPIAFDPDVLRKGAEYVRDANRSVADLIGINHAKRATTVKPSGTASLSLGCVGSGIHPHHAHRYFRRVTANPNEACAQFFRQHNPHMVETKPNGDWCITFPVEAPQYRKVSWGEFLTQVIVTYTNWVIPGGVTKLTHNVSCTMVVPEGEWDAVFDAVWDNRFRIAAMSFLPEMSDKGIPFMPRETATEEDVDRWNKLCREYKVVPWHEMVELHDDTALRMAIACAGGACDVG
jgi:ribonucleoside-triphosphate reductase (thioredoxin)